MTKWNTTEYGTPLCPVPHTRWDYDESGDKQVSVTEPCGEELMLAVSLNVPIVVDMRYEVADASHDAIASAWEVKCMRGHVLAMSDAEESAEDFDWFEVFERG